MLLCCSVGVDQKNGPVTEWYVNFADEDLFFGYGLLSACLMFDVVFVFAVLVVVLLLLSVGL